MGFFARMSDKSQQSESTEHGAESPATETTPHDVIVISSKANEKFYFWNRPGTSEEERKLVQKLDLTVLVFCCLTFFAKDLDRNNINNAYVSGMKEDLNLYGNELNWMVTWFQIGYIVGQIPSQILLTRISPRWYLPAAEFLWAFFVLFLHKCQTPEQIYALRFCVGFAEAASWPGLHFMIGTWYRNHEINKRSGIFTASGIAATMFSGYIQAGIYQTIDGHLGIRGWRWLFIIDFLITCPMVAIGLVIIPNPLFEKSTWWMTERERQMCMKRLEADNRKPLGHFDRSLFKRLLGRWHFWILCTWFYLMYFVYQAPTTSTMALWLKAEKYSVPDVNNLPTVYSAISIAFMLFSGTYNDWRNSQLESVVLICILQIISESMLVAWDLSKPAIFFAFYIAGTVQSLFPIIVSWTHMVCSADAEERAIVIGALNSIGLAQGTWWNQVFVPTVEAPRFHRGYRAGLAASLALAAWLPVVVWFTRRQQRQERKNATISGQAIESSIHDAEEGTASLNKQGASPNLAEHKKEEAGITA
ncbi:MFS general substrate transporter [Durotheca rogersii]|uniref:MFS general substrate transporter n=1 Tax=Durotheca rogersii TaxID=419775 RepID=UPI00221EF4DE|nr:MFS general substrate transporter [Durotheca rogersii]KAI5866535.1 MFS general substrate transporter [Durotheca rogersii]